MSLSVCIPAHNAARTLQATLDSVLQNDAEFELVVVNNASSDATEEIARSVSDRRVVVHSTDEFLSIGHSWNRTVSLSTGSLVKVVCADDLIEPDALDRQSSVMADDSVTLAASRYDVIDEFGNLEESGLGLQGLEGHRDARAVFRTVVREGPAGFGPTASAIFRRELFDRVGGFRGDLVFPMDVDLFARIAAFGRFYGDPGALASWRNSRFNLCAQTTSQSKVAEMFHGNRRLRAEHPDLVSAADVLLGDLRLFNAGLTRVGARVARMVNHGAQ
ncbi:glycosyltransferase family 2 protein [Gordonia polyisoprenivorans]|uniref:glycosyltransferase family 2 protein n=1 Tax=Gordonia polyisoprenivorans TaxID=84595 RepID=UPI001AD6ED44|nr:glycosyltransferase family A protein [Gordonia polyisoprenivorans]QTI70578.1 glycosyltransferase family 2 protein [Gordonia polyisoprenivorans]